MFKFALKKIAFMNIWDDKEESILFIKRKINIEKIY